MSTDEDQSTTVLLKVDRHVDGSSTARRQGCRPIERNFVFSFLKKKTRQRVP